MEKSSDILLLGDLMLDKYYWGEASRISPEAPVPIVNLEDIEDRLGGAANVALNIASTGASVKVHGYIGKDESGAVLKNLLTKNNISIDLFEGTSSTTTKSRIMSMGQQLLRVDNEEICSEEDSKKILKKFIQDISSSRLIVISDYSKGVIANLKDIISAASKKSIPILIDPKSKKIELYRSAFMLTPNLKEFKNFNGYDSSKSIYENAVRLSNDHNINWFIITMGPEGMMAVNKDGTHYSLNTESKDVVDVTGAGDTVLSYIAYGILNNYSVPDSLILANKAAGIAVGLLGSVPVKLSDFKLLEQKNIYNISSRNEFLKILNEQSKNKKVVMTNGCFDIIHPGHVEYLRKSKENGDILVVAVNSDRSIKSIKGDSRPINSFAYRAKVLSSLEMVDIVVEFDEDTPEELIKIIMPDVLTKGSDYAISEIAGSEIVISNGGKVILVELVEGYSTSSILSKILNST